MGVVEKLAPIAVEREEGRFGEVWADDCEVWADDWQEAWLDRVRLSKLRPFRSDAVATGHEVPRRERVSG